MALTALTIEATAVCIHHTLVLTPTVVIWGAMEVTGVMVDIIIMAVLVTASAPKAGILALALFRRFVLTVFCCFSFIRLAEESTRPAFQSIESVVRAFGGISMMMDSTFFAITSSFRAVLGIADNIGQLRSMFSQIWSSFALFRLISWIYRKVLSLFGIKVGLTGGNKAWEQAINGGVPESPSGPKGHNWPIFLFLGIILSAPYLISKMIPSVDGK